MPAPHSSSRGSPLSLRRYHSTLIRSCSAVCGRRTVDHSPASGSTISRPLANSSLEFRPAQAPPHWSRPSPLLAPVTSATLSVILAIRALLPLHAGVLNMGDINYPSAAGSASLPLGLDARPCVRPAPALLRPGPEPAASRRLNCFSRDPPLRFRRWNDARIFRDRADDHAGAGGDHPGPRNAELAQRHPEQPRRHANAGRRLDADRAGWRLFPPDDRWRRCGALVRARASIVTCSMVFVG